MNNLEIIRTAALIFINDLETDILSHVKFFADDTMLFDLVNGPDTTSVILNLFRVQNWAQWNCFSLKENTIVQHPSTSIIFMCKM